MKRILSILLLILLLAMPVQAAEEKVNIIVKGYAIEDDKAEIIDGRTFVPLRLISEKLGAKVDYYYEKDKQIVIEKSDLKILMNVNKLEAKVNNYEIKLEVKPYIKDGSTMVPLRFISETLGEEVEWDSKSWTAIIGLIAGQEPEEETVRMEFKSLNGSIYFPEDYEKDVEISTKTLTEGDVTIISHKLKESNIEGVGAILVLNNSRNPILDSDHGYNLFYNPFTENFVTVSYPLSSSFPKAIRKEVEDLQQEYMEHIRTFNPTILQANMENLKWSKANQKIWNKLDILKNIFLPRDYFYYNIPYTEKTEEGTLVYLYNANEEGETESDVEMTFYEENLITFKISFDTEAEDLNKPGTEEEAVKTIKLFQELVLDYPQDKLPEVELKEDKKITGYEEDIYVVFTDSESNLFIYNMERSLLEFFSKPIK